MKRIWNFLSNTFEVVTRQSFRKMFNIGNNHLVNLEAESSDPDVQELLDEYKPIYEDFRKAFSKIKANLGFQKGQTEAFVNLLKKLQEQWLPIWEGKVYSVYPKGTPISTSIFPNNRSTFYNGTYDEILLGVERLADVVEMYEPIKDLERDIREKFNLLNESRTAQGKVKSKGGMYSDELETKRVALANALYGNLGKLIYKFRADPVQVERFFKLSLLRRASTSGEDGIVVVETVPAGGLKALAFPKGVTPDGAFTYSITNQSNETSLWMYFAPNSSTLDSSTKVDLNPNTTTEATALDLGWSEENMVLLLRNIGLAEAPVEVSIFPPEPS